MEIFHSDIHMLGFLVFNRKCWRNVLICAFDIDTFPLHVSQLLAVKKLDNTSLMLQTDESFLKLVSIISKLQHANVVKLVGYCAEHRQCLLVYEYCSNGTLNDVLHSGHELNKKLSWNARIRIALGAARALE